MDTLNVSPLVIGPNGLARPIEDESKRTEHHKHIAVGVTDSGETLYEVVASPVPLHYQKDGQWVDIKPEWVDGEVRGVPYEGVRLDGVGCDRLKLLTGTIPEARVEGHRVWWDEVAPDTSVVLIAHATGLQLHLILWGPSAPREFTFYAPDAPEPEFKGRDNIDLHVARPGKEQHYEVDVRWDRDGDFVTKVVRHRVRAFDRDRRKHWSGDVAYPVRVT